MLESPLLRDIRVALGALPGVLSERANTGKHIVCVKCRAGFPQGYAGPCKYCGESSRYALHYGTPGGPDLRLIVGGRFLGLEVKIATGRQSPEQKVWQRACEAAGGVYVVVRSAAEARAAVEGVR